jgi:hypothetical protein
MKEQMNQTEGSSMADGFDRRTLLGGAGGLALMAAAERSLWELFLCSPPTDQEAWLDSIFWTDGTGWVA